MPPATGGSSSFGASSDAGFGAGEPCPADAAGVRRADRLLAARAAASAPVLRFDDGLVVTVDEDLVLGRRPDNHELVTAGNARPVPIADTQNVLSSAHAALQRSGREVSLVDLGSLNGTHVAGPEATEWTQLEPGVAHPLSDGDRLLLGWTVITFEQPARVALRPKRTEAPFRTSGTGPQRASSAERVRAGGGPGAPRRSGRGARPVPGRPSSSPGARRSGTRWRATSS